MKMYKRYTLQDTLDSEKRNLFNVLSTFDYLTTHQQTIDYLFNKIHND